MRCINYLLTYLLQRYETFKLNRPNDSLLKILVHLTKNHVSLDAVNLYYSGTLWNWKRLSSIGSCISSCRLQRWTDSVSVAHVSLDAVHLLLELGPLGVHARDNVADVADDRREDENCDEELDDDEDVLNRKESPWSTDRPRGVKRYVMGHG